jgi:hypothetical protein
MGLCLSAIMADRITKSEQVMLEGLEVREVRATTVTAR